MSDNQARVKNSLRLGEDDAVLVSGPLTFDNAVQIHAEGNAFIKQSKANPCVFDLSGVTQAGSAGVSLLLSWLRYARARSIELVFSNVPPGLLGVAQVSGIDEILPIKENPAV